MDVNRLVDAACKGDVDVLREVCEDVDKKSMAYTFGVGKLIHRAVKANHYTFVSEILKMLPNDALIKLVCEPDTEGYNPLHYAAKEGNIFTVKLLVNAYVTAADFLRHQGTPPWLLSRNMKVDATTPIQCCFTKESGKPHEGVAMYLVSRDQHMLRSLGDQKYLSLFSKKYLSPEESSTNAVDNTGAGILFCAMRKGFSLLAEQILTSDLPYALNGSDGLNPLHYASNCNERVSRLLLEKHPELIGNKESGCTVLDRAVENEAVWLVELMLIEDKDAIHCLRPWNKACRRLIWHSNPNSYGETPLHVAARKGYLGVAKLIVQGYESAIHDEAKEWDVAEAHSANDHLGVTPLRIENSHKDIPLFVAFKNKHDDFGVYISSIETTIYIVHLKDGEGKTAYEIAMENGCEQSRDEIFATTVLHSTEDLLTLGPNDERLHPRVRQIVRHIVSTYSAGAGSSEILTSENMAKLAVEGIPMFVREPNKDAILHLKDAAGRGDDWLVKLLLEGDNSLINDSAPAWQIACQKGHLSTLRLFTKRFGREPFVIHCRSNQQTPLHHINLPSYEEYKKFSAKSRLQDLINQLDSGEATPLHRALERGNIALAKALLGTKGIKLDIENPQNRAAFAILEEKYIADNARFFELYKAMLANPHIPPALKNRVDTRGTTLLHRAIERNDFVLTKELLKTKAIKVDITENVNGKTALDLLEDRCDGNDNVFELYKEYLAGSLMTSSLKNRTDNNGATSLHRAIRNNSRRLVSALVETKGVKVEVNDNNRKTAFGLIEEKCTNRSNDTFWYELYKKLFENSNRFEKMLNRKGSTGATPLHIAIEWDDLKLTKKLVHTKGIELTIKNGNRKTALELIVERCDQDDSLWYSLYKELLNDPNYVHELKNQQVGINAETPLHLAIRRHDIKLAKLLLETNGVEVDIKDRNGKTSLDLLKDCYTSGKWSAMCREIKVDPNLKVFKYKYLLRRTPLADMRGTLSVVAALLATISFAAGFTVPGGLDSHGTTMLGKKAAFIVFSIANTIAMCSSMVVLFMLIGAMIWGAHPKATPLIDWCVFLLQLSLFGTIIAFMTGVYAILAPVVLWAAAVVIGVCSLAFLGASYVVTTFWPILYKLVCCIFGCGICFGNRATSTPVVAVVPAQNQNPQPSTHITQTASATASTVANSRATSSVQQSRNPQQPATTNTLARANLQV